MLQVWNDYLSMAKRLGMDIHDSIIYRTRDLQLRHKEAVLKIEEMKRGIRRRELEEKYVGFQKHLIDLKEKYEFSDGEYQVIAPKSIDDMFIMDRMAPLQIKNYLEKQAAESGESVKNLIKTWKDYLNMAIRVGVNVQDSVIYRARKLMQRHNEMIKEIEAKDLILRAGELEKKYPGLNRICRDLKKYEYADKEYRIVVPEKVDDILYEAKLMHHCVNNTETYYERMSQQESYILFLRKAEQPTEAYYTLEVEPDGTIRQTRTFYNQQNEDIELARDFLVKWQKQLKKKLAKEDYKLAVKSQSLRKKEIEELRSKGVRVNGVGYCNKLLAEILEEDLMEAGNRELEEQAA